MYVEKWSTRLVRESTTVPVELESIRGPQNVPRLFWAVVPEDACCEHFVGFYLNARHQVRGIEMLTKGVADASLIHPREVFRSAILANAAGVIVAHNHPSGDPTPSPEDRAVTRQLQEAGKTVGIPLLDHVVLGGDRWTSILD